MTITFKAKTQEGYSIKILAELLQHNLKTACFEIDKNGVKLRMTDTQKRILIDLQLDYENYSIYKYKLSEKSYLGINLNHFHKMLKSIKKKDSIVLFINDIAMSDLGIEVLPKEKNRVTTSYVKIQSIQNLDIELPEGYEKPIIVPSNEFQKMIKDMTNISNTIGIISKNYQIKFVCDAGSVYKREVVFGETDDDDDDDYDDTEEYSDEFDTEQLSRIIKMAGLYPTMQIYVKKGLPLLFQTNVGGLGKIRIYIKSKKQMEERNYTLVD